MTPRSPDPFSLVEAALPTLVSMLMRIGRKKLGAADLDDVLGETLLKLLIAVKQSHHRRPIANLAALANTILNRQVSNLRRAARTAIVVNSIGIVEPVASLDTTEPQDAGRERRLSRPLALPGKRQRIIRGDHPCGRLRRRRSRKVVGTEEGDFEDHQKNL